MTIHIKIPFSLEKNLGKAYNDAFRQVDDDDWICMIDHDVMFLTPNSINLLYKYVEILPHTGIFTCWTNRIHPLAKGQLYNGEVSEETDILHHIEIAQRLSENAANITRLREPISGFLMLVSKKTWSTIPFNEEMKCLGVDNDFSAQVLNAGLQICRMDTLYVWHSYRLAKGITNKEHLY